MTEQELPLGALNALPPPWPLDVLPAIRAAMTQRPRKVVILDDDPTGTQTIAGLPVLTRWTIPELEAEFADPAPGFFVLTNSRSLTEAATRELHQEIARRLRAAAQGRPFTIISRSDSTLRGHFPAETDALADIFGTFDLLLLAPYFEAGGRYTLNDVHYVKDADRLIPAAATVFARDATFGYQHSHLARWVEEKTAGRVSADAVRSVSLETIRLGGVPAVAEALAGFPSGSIVIVNAAAPSDIEIVAAATLMSEAAGRRLLYRTAAAFVAARTGQRPPPLLEPVPPAASSAPGGLVVAGSYVPQTTAQIEWLRSAHPITPIELAVDALLDPARRANAIDRASSQMNSVLAAGRDTLVFTSRQLVRDADSSTSLAIGRTVADGLIAVVQALAVRPRFLIAKGGITSSDIATIALGVRRAVVAGQVLPGVPVWILGEETPYPGLNYVVFPGNVGGVTALAEAVARIGTRAPADCGSKIGRCTRP